MDFTQKLVDSIIVAEHDHNISTTQPEKKWPDLERERAAELRGEARAADDNHP